MKGQYSNLDEFWPFYVSQHLHPINRRLHFMGTSLGLVLLAASAVLGRLGLIAVAVLVGYAFAWVGHFFYERNRPATFRYPLLSFRADLRMWRLMLLGEMGAELLRLTPVLRGPRTEEGA